MKKNLAEVVTSVKRRNKLILFLAVLFVVVLVIAPVSYCAYRNSGPVILMYHHIAPAGAYSGTDNQNNNAILKLDHFEGQMKYLSEQGYHTLFLSEVYEILQEGKEFPPKSLVITFDDGYESNYIYAHPIIEKYNLKANLAIVVRPTERRDEYPDPSPYNPASLRHITFDQLREMNATGLWEFGSHTFDSHGHVNIDDEAGTASALVNYKYNTITKHRETHEEYVDRITMDLARSRDVLRAELGVSPTFFSYPEGRYNKSVIEVCKRVGFKCALTVNKGGVHSVDQLYKLPRHNVDNSMTLEKLEKLLAY